MGTDSHVRFNDGSGNYLDVSSTNPLPVDAVLEMGDEVTIYGASTATATNGSVTVANTSTTILAAKADRLFASIKNVSDEEITLNFGATATINTGIVLGIGEGYEINMTNRYVGEITGICATGGKSVVVVEG